MKTKRFIVMTLVLFVFCLGHLGAEEKPALAGLEIKGGPSIQLTNHSPIARTYVLYQLDHEQFSGSTRLCAGEIKTKDTKIIRDPCKPGKYMLMMHPGLFQVGKSYRKFFKVTASMEEVIVNFKEGEENEKNFYEMNI
jgi:hypothetical protein